MTLSFSAMEDASLMLSRGDLNRAKSILEDAISQSQPGDDALLDSCCMRASIAAMEGADPSEIGRILNRSGTSSDSTMYRSYLDGVAALARGSKDFATRKFEEVLRVEPHFILANLGLATAKYLAKDYTGSFGQFRIVLERLGDAVPGVVRVALGLCAYQLQDREHAMKCAERALDVDSQDALALLLMLQLVLEKRNMRKLAEVVEQLRRVVPGNVLVIQRVADLMYGKAVAARSVKERSRSLLHLINSVLPSANEIQTAYARFQQGRVLHCLGRVEEAKQDFLAALETVPNLTAAKIHLAKIQYKMGERAEAISMLKSLLSSAPAEIEILQMLAVHHAEEGNHEAAIEYAKKLVELAPGESSSWAIAGWCSRLDGPASCAQLSRAVALMTSLQEPVPWELRFDLASLDSSVTADRLENMIMERLTEKNVSRDHVEMAPALFNLGLKLESSNVDRAVACYTSLIKSQPAFHEAYLRLFRIALSRGQARQAFSWLALMKQSSGAHDADLISISEADALVSLGSRNTAERLIKINGRKSIHTALALGSMCLYRAQETSSQAVKNLQTARNRFEYVLHRDPSNMLAAHGIACCTGMASGATEAQLCFDRIAELPPNQGYVAANIHEHVANVRIMCDSLLGAAIAVEAAPHKTAAQYSALAFCFAGSGRFSEATHAIEEGLAKFPTHFALKYNAALVYCSAVMDALLPQRNASLTEDAATTLSLWMMKGIGYARSIVEANSLPPEFGPSSTTQDFVKIVAHHTYQLKERIHALLRAGATEKVRLRRDAEAWKRKHQETQDQQEQAAQRSRDDKLLEEGQLTDSYAVLRARMQNLTQPNGIHNTEYTDIPYPDGDDLQHRRQREDDDQAEQQGDLHAMDMAPTLAIAGMYVADSNVELSNQQ